jgi:O-antigen/teichoic acid export membrane protein
MMKTELIELAADNPPSVAPWPDLAGPGAFAGRHLVARSAMLSLLGEGTPLLAGLVSMPYLVRGLGPEEFGLLSIAWVLLGYFGLFDLGLGRATVKFAAEHLGRAEVHLLDRLIGTSLVLQFVLGTCGALVLAALTPILVHRFFKIPPHLVPDARLTLLILAVGLPFVLTLNCLRGVLEAAQRFDLINYVKIPSNSALFLVPAILALLQIGLPVIVLCMVLIRAAATLTYLVLCRYALPSWHFELSLDSHVLTRLLRFGGWVTTSNVVGPILVYMDRFFIGSALTVAAVGFYTAPADMVNRMLVVPVSLAAALFPAFSSMDGAGAKGQIGVFYGRAIKYVALTLGPLLLSVAYFAHEILRLWLGPAFAAKSGTVLAILALSVLVNALAYLPYILLQGTGRPDIPARFHLLELPLYAILLWILVPRMGLVGAAVACALRVTLDAGLLFGAASRLRLSSLNNLKEAGLQRGVLVLLAMALALLLGSSLRLTPVSKFGYSLAVIFSFGVMLWKYLFDNRDRALMLSTARRLLRPHKPSESW